MVPVDRKAGRTQAFTALWTFVLLPPVAWSTAFGVMYSMTNDVCIQQASRISMAAITVVCCLLSLAAAGMAWQWRRGVSAEAPGGARTRFMLELAAGASLIFILVMLLMLAPVMFLDPCRT
jgi:hypothetical protein